MTETAPSPSEALAPECHILTRYLTGTDATPYVLEKYQEGHIGLYNAYGASPPWFDRALLAIAQRGPFGTGLVDSYTRWFCPGSIVRYKLTLLLAVLGSGVVLAGLREATILLAGIVVLGPLHVWAVTTGYRA
jgi:hypothetical protein